MQQRRDRLDRLAQEWLDGIASPKVALAFSVLDTSERELLRIHLADDDRTVPAKAKAIGVSTRHYYDTVGRTKAKVHGALLFLSELSAAAS